MTLREVRFFSDLTQWDISVKTGIPQSKLSLIERGYIHPRDHEKRKIAEALNCEVSHIFPKNEMKAKGKGEQ